MREITSEVERFYQAGQKLTIEFVYQGQVIGGTEADGQMLMKEGFHIQKEPTPDWVKIAIQESIDRGDKGICLKYGLGWDPPPPRFFKED